MAMVSRRVRRYGLIRYRGVSVPYNGSRIRLRNLKRRFLRW